eukprot:7030597-Lingulodinium_polyedra.AAC.1
MQCANVRLPNRCGGGRSIRPHRLCTALQTLHNDAVAGCCLCCLGAACVLLWVLLGCCLGAAWVLLGC